MELPNKENCHVDERKVTDYLLNTSRMPAAAKARSGKFNWVSLRTSCARCDAGRARQGVSCSEGRTELIGSAGSTLPWLDFRWDHWNKLGARLGLRTAESWTDTIGKHRVIVVKRYDRLPVEGRLLRVHQEDFCQALGVKPEDKYQKDRSRDGERRVLTLMETRARTAQPQVSLAVAPNNR
jgi:hypothetical protein